MRTRTTHMLRPFGADASGPMPAAIYFAARPSTDMPFMPLRRDDAPAAGEHGSPGTGLGAATTHGEAREPGAGEMACPVCGHLMPDLKGGKATICPVCGFKDSCCY